MDVQVPINLIPERYVPDLLATCKGSLLVWLQRLLPTHRLVAHAPMESKLARSNRAIWSLVRASTPAAAPVMQARSPALPTHPSSGLQLLQRAPIHWTIPHLHLQPRPCCFCVHTAAGMWAAADTTGARPHHTPHRTFPAQPNFPLTAWVPRHLACGCTIPGFAPPPPPSRNRPTAHGNRRATRTR